MTRLLTILLLALSPVAAQAQQQSSQQQQRQRQAAEAARLESEIVQKFIEQITRDLGLDAAQRVQTERVLKQSGERRRELLGATRDLRSRMYRALRAKTTTDADFTRLLAEFDALREREHDLWQRDQEELARLYTPRQRVHFLMAWTRFQDSMRDIITKRMREGGATRNH